MGDSSCSEPEHHVCAGSQDENGGAGVYSADERKRYLLEDESWRRDIIPEIMDGHNILDFVDPDIEARLEALERDEDEAAAAFEASVCLWLMLVFVSLGLWLEFSHLQRISMGSMLHDQSCLGQGKHFQL